MMPSATCLLKRPVSYVWQPNDARTLARPLSDEKKTSSSTIRPRIDEPSVYDTEYPQSPFAQFEQCMPDGGDAHLSSFDVDESAGLNLAPALWKPQCAQLEHGIAVSAEPVSTISSNSCSRAPTHSSAAK